MASITIKLGKEEIQKAIQHYIETTTNLSGDVAVVSLSAENAELHITPRSHLTPNRGNVAGFAAGPTPGTIATPGVITAKN